jgi:hypothetical protein
LDEVEAVLDRRVAGSEMVEVLHRSSVLGRRVEVVHRVPRVLAPDERLLERHVEVLLRTEVVASVSLPGLGGGHGLTAEHVVGRAVVEEVERLLVAVVVERDSREEDRGDESTEKGLGRSKLERSPSEDVEVTDSATGRKGREGDQGSARDLERRRA